MKIILINNDEFMKWIQIKIENSYEPLKIFVKMYPVLTLFSTTVLTFSFNLLPGE